MIVWLNLHSLVFISAHQLHLAYQSATADTARPSCLHAHPSFPIPNSGLTSPPLIIMLLLVLEEAGKGETSQRASDMYIQLYTTSLIAMNSPA